MEEAQRAPEDREPFGARLATQRPALPQHTCLARGNLLWQHRINIKFHTPSVKTYNKQARYFKSIADTLFLKKHFLVLICKLYSVEGHCSESILLPKGEGTNPHRCTRGFPGAQPHGGAQGSDPQPLQTAVAGHAHKPTKSPPSLPQDALPSLAPGRPNAQEAVPGQGRAHTEEVAPDALPAMTNGWAESSASNRSLRKQERDPRDMSPSTHFGPN